MLPYDCCFANVARMKLYKTDLRFCYPLVLSQAVDDYLQLNVPITSSGGVVRVLSSSDVERGASDVPSRVGDKVEDTVSNIFRLYQTNW